VRSMYLYRKEKVGSRIRELCVVKKYQFKSEK